MTAEPSPGPHDPQDGDPWNLARFIEAQSAVYPRVLEELRSARKQSHWMWFIFPQIAGLGSSPISQHFALSGREEALAYLAHPVLGPRLRECTDLVLAAPGGTPIDRIFPYPDDLKFRSSLTLFHLVNPDEQRFRAALERFFPDEPDTATPKLLDHAERT